MFGFLYRTRKGKIIVNYLVLVVNKYKLNLLVRFFRTTEFILSLLILIENK